MYQAKDFAHLQLELIDTKVNMAATNLTHSIIEQIRGLKDEMHGMRHEMQSMRIEIKYEMQEMHTEIKHEMQEMRSEIKDEMQEMRIELKEDIHQINVRLTAVETKLGMVNNKRNKIINHWLDYTFKGGWIITLSIISYVFLKFHFTLAAG